jgi:hypothetical protein
MTDDRFAAWPALPYDAWRETCDTLHLWTQVVGKIRMVQTPWVNHSWHVTLYVTPCGLTTSAVPYGGRSFQIDFDFRDHLLVILVDDGSRRTIRLEPKSVAAFYREVMSAMDDLGLPVHITMVPNEIADAIPFDEDETHASYDPEYARRFGQVLVSSARVLSEFRARFVGKCSPVHFFWGGFDLAVTRFSGRTAPEHPGGVPNMPDWVAREAYSHENISAGFWPGSGIGEAAFYSYTYPEPEGYRDYDVKPDAAYYHDELREFVLPYEAVRTADEPERALMAFLQTTYEAGSVPAEWDPALVFNLAGVRRRSIH